MILNDIETSKQARLVLRELVRGNKSRAQLWSALIDNQLDDVDLRFILPPLEQDGYIEEVEDKWHILPKGVRYMDTYDRMMLESVEGYLVGSSMKTKLTPQERKREAEGAWNRKMTIVGIVIALLSAIAAYTSPLLERGWQALLSLILGK